MIRIVPLLDRMTIDCVYAPPDRYRTPRSRSPDVTPVATIPLTMAATDDLGLASMRLQSEQTVHREGKSEPTIDKKTVAIPMETGGGRAILDHQARHLARRAQAGEPDRAHVAI